MEYICRKNDRDLRVFIDEIATTMRDGTPLYTLLLRPEKPGKYPIVFVRNPYVSGDPGIAGICAEYFSLLAGGYALVFQHCRGTGRSGGDCVPYDFERNDGLDTLAHIRKLDCYNGEIYPVGGSYLSSVHLSYLATAPADVKGAVLCVQDADRYNILYRNGFFKAGLHGGWYVGMYKKNSMPHKNYAVDSFRMLPLAKFSEAVFGEPVPAFDESLKHPDRNDPYWRTPAGGSEFSGALENLRVPVLLTTAWHDIYTEGVLRMWDRLPAENRQNCALLVTPWDHDFSRGGSAPVRFENGELASAWPDFILNWLNSIRSGEPLRLVRRGEVTWYNTFGGAWRTAPSVGRGPVPLTLFLRAARTLTRTPGDSAALTYTYNPFAPAEFKGGCCNNFGGMQVQDAPNSRYDILSFVSDPFAEVRDVRGPVELVLHVRSDAPDTCFYARLSLVRDNIAYGLRDDITAVSNAVPEYRPGDDAVVRLRFAEHAFRIGAGDRLRLDVSSSCWPYFVPHTNRRGLFSAQTGADIAHNTVLCGKSALTLYLES